MDSQGYGCLDYENAVGLGLLTLACGMACLSPSFVVLDCFIPLERELYAPRAISEDILRWVLPLLVLVGKCEWLHLYHVEKVQPYWSRRIWRYLSASSILSLRRGLIHDETRNSL